MGVYVNVENEQKELWLEREALEVNQPPIFEDIPTNQKLVVLVDNGPFTAAAVAYSEGEYRAFTRNDEIRPRRYFLADTDKIREVSNLASVES